LRNALVTRYFKRYHPLQSLKKWTDFYRKDPLLTVSNIDLTALKYDYVFEIQEAMLVPAFKEMPYTKKQAIKHFEFELTAKQGL
jgi:hypothetical protein